MPTTSAELRKHSVVKGLALCERMGNTRNDWPKLDVRAVYFWITGQQAFFDIRVFDLSVQR